MHDFKYKTNRLYCEDVPLEAIADRVGTPFYAYSLSTLTSHFKKLKEAFRSQSPLICFSMKSNSSLALCRALVKLGAGLDVVSGGELYKALKIKADPKRIVYASVGKTEKEIAQAIKAGILLFNVESAPELELINTLAGRLNRNIGVCLRINPDVDAETHRYISTGRAVDKFGIDLKTAQDLFGNAGRFKNLRLEGVHLHIGSQITEPAPFIKAIKAALGFIDSLKRYPRAIKWLNIGGGLGIVYSHEKPQTAEEFAKAVLPFLKKRRLKLILEPGRFISGNSGILVTRVIYVKKTPRKRFIIVDAGMNDLVRPSLYEAYHQILPVSASWFLLPRTSWSKADVVGPVCETGDFLAKDRRMPPLEGGQLLAVMGAGAYGFTMSSNYNSRPRCPEVLVKGDKFYVTRRREKYSDLIRGEKLPKFLR